MPRLNPQQAHNIVNTDKSLESRVQGKLARPVREGVAGKGPAPGLAPRRRPTSAPTLLDSVFKTILPVMTTDPSHVVEERGHGRINRWETWITDAAGIDFPHVRQVACIRRNVFTPAGTWISKEHAWIATSGDSTHTTAAYLHTQVRQHWGIENKSHYVRDTTWREDAQQAYTGSGPQVMATLRNMAAGLLRLNGFTKIKETTEWIGRDRNRALPLLATQSNRHYLQ